MPYTLVWYSTALLLTQEVHSQPEKCSEGLWSWDPLVLPCSLPPRSVCSDRKMEQPFEDTVTAPIRWQQGSLTTVLLKRFWDFHSRGCGGRLVRQEQLVTGREKSSLLLRPRVQANRETRCPGASWRTSGTKAVHNTLSQFCGSAETAQASSCWNRRSGSCLETPPRGQMSTRQYKVNRKEPAVGWGLCFFVFN